MTEEDAILGFVRDPQFEKANSALEFVVSVPEMDKVAAEWNFIFGDAEGDFAGRDRHEVHHGGDCRFGEAGRRGSAFKFPGNHRAFILERAHRQGNSDCR